MFNFSNDLWRKHGVRWWWPLSLAVMSTRHWRWLLRRSFVSHYYVVVVISLPSLKKKRLTIMWGSSFLRKRLLIFFFYAILFLAHLNILLWLFFCLINIYSLVRVTVDFSITKKKHTKNIQCVFIMLFLF